jgi:8-oxo-dGTP pyrophosphatase MutT (NUDIX family)
MRMWHERAILEENRIRAAVAMVFTRAEGLAQKVLLTLRRPDLATHAGQVSFPGGMMEEKDGGDSEVTARRELQEEVGVAGGLSRIQVFPPFPTVTGNFLIDPYLFECSEELPLQVDPSEVVRAEYVSLLELQQTFTLEERKIFGNPVQLPVFYWHNEKVWGVTAMLLASAVPMLMKKE